MSSRCKHVLRIGPDNNNEEAKTEGWWWGDWANYPHPPDTHWGASRGRAGGTRDRSTPRDVGILLFRSDMVAVETGVQLLCLSLPWTHSQPLN
ncbi:hypothetical protein O3P69_016630 [Scylla paramamosain]|uniref:Uncharacterized protein n=1 Tax=Scylla paramamosain TaxID=85552 RepID=A0AAW0SZG0_SCYPA